MDLKGIRQIVVIGAGTMGLEIAEVAIISGFEVTLNDIKQEFLDNAVKRIKNSLEKFVSKNKITREEMVDSLKRLSITLDMKEAVKNADIVIEAVPEILPLKKEIFKKVDGLLTKDSIIASNT